MESLTLRFPVGAKVPQRLRKHPQERTEEGQVLQMMLGPGDTESGGGFPG